MRVLNKRRMSRVLPSKHDRFIVQRTIEKPIIVYIIFLRPEKYKKSLNCLLYVNSTELFSEFIIKFKELLDNLRILRMKLKRFLYNTDFFNLT